VGNCLYDKQALSSDAEGVVSRSEKYRLEFTAAGGLLIYYVDGTGSRISMWDYPIVDGVDGVSNLLVTKLGNLKVQNSAFTTVFEAQTTGDNVFAILQVRQVK
jgi:hypothetical protein